MQIRDIINTVYTRHAHTSENKEIQDMEHSIRLNNKSACIQHSIK